MFKDVLCMRGCGQWIHFDPSQKSQSGKMIPLNKDGSPHNCPNNQYFKDVQSGSTGKIVQTKTQISSGGTNYQSNQLLVDLDQKLHEMDSKIDKIIEYLKRNGYIDDSKPDESVVNDHGSEQF